MYIALRKRYADTLGIETFFERLSEIKVNIPVLTGLHPGTNSKVDTAVSELNNADRHGWIGQYASNQLR